MEARQVQQALQAIVNNPELLKLVDLEVANDASELLWSYYCEAIEQDIYRDDQESALEALQEHLDQAYGELHGLN